MSRKNDRAHVCAVCGQRKSHDEMMPLEMVRPAIVEMILRDRPDLDERGQICLVDLRRFRTAHIESLLAAERGELTELESDVLQSFAEYELLTENVNTDLDASLTLGQRVADRISDFGGSWTFIIMFGGFCVLWMALNAGFLLFQPFDPYPFILLNLFLSCIAAFQAPVIIMSQKRQEARDRLRAEHDYRVNLKAELEIRQLHEKLDHLILHQWQRLIEIQQSQMDLLEALALHKK